MEGRGQGWPKKEEKKEDKPSNLVLNWLCWPEWMWSGSLPPPSPPCQNSSNKIYSSKLLSCEAADATARRQAWSESVNHGDGRGENRLNLAIYTQSSMQLGWQGWLPSNPPPPTHLLSIKEYIHSNSSSCGCMRQLVTMTRRPVQSQSIECVIREKEQTFMTAVS